MNGSCRPKHFKYIYGVTLLEMIVVLAIIGMTMTIYANHHRKEAKKSSYQSISNTVVREISGVLDFLEQEQLEVLVNGKAGATIANPFYDQNSSALYHARVVGKTVQDEPVNISAGQSYSGWNVDSVNKISLNNGTRFLFLGQECGSTSGAMIGSKLANNKLSCKLPKGSDSRELVLERIDLVNNAVDPTSGNIKDPALKLKIERVDFYLVHNKMQRKDGLHFIEYTQYLNKELDKIGLSYLNAMVLEWNGSSNPIFSLVKVNNKPVSLSDVAGLINSLDENKNYSIRLSFNKTSEPLVADGSAPASKLCWSSAKGEAGPCITAKDKDRLVIASSDASVEKEAAMCWDKGTNTSVLCLSAMNSNGINPIGNNPDDRILHLRTVGQNADGTETAPVDPSSRKGTTGTLYANIVMENTSRKHPEKWHMAYSASEALALKDATENNDNSSLEFADAFKNQYELVTPPVVFYQSFKNDYPAGKLPSGASQTYIASQNAANYDSLLSEPGVIRLPLQTCPKVAGVSSDNKPLSRVLYPRLSVALSSIAADSSDSGNNTSYMDYTQLGATRANTEKVSVVGAIAGVAVQANIVVASDIANNSANKPLKVGSTFEGWVSDKWFTGSNNKAPFWLISATSGTINLEGDGTNKINPESLSVMITQWCSTIPQGGVISSEGVSWNSSAAKYLLHSIVEENSNQKFYDNTGRELDIPDHDRLMY